MDGRSHPRLHHHQRGVPDLRVQSVALVAAFNATGEILLLKRPDEVHCGGLWSFPGGKIGADEAPMDAARRELLEETGLIGKHWQRLGASSHAYPDTALAFELFACRVADVSGLNPESDFAWVNRDRLSDYPMPAANADFITRIRESSAFTE